MSVEEKISLTNVSYHVSVSTVELLRTATITPKATIMSDRKRGLIVDLKVDGHELLPTAKIHVEKGESEHTLKPVEIRQRLSSRKSEPQTGRTYKMELRVSPNGDDYVIDEQTLEIHARS